MRKQRSAKDGLTRQTRSEKREPTLYFLTEREQNTLHKWAVNEVERIRKHYVKCRGFGDEKMSRGEALSFLIIDLGDKNISTERDQ